MTPGSATPLDALLADRRVVVCCGSGGVGKTTVSAALALRGAGLGRKVLVCTIDPARRLANAMGIARLGDRERRVPPERLTAAGVLPGGALWAMMLDTKRTFDRLVERYAPDPASRDRILANGFYQNLSNQVMGSQEYMAMEKLYELREEGGYDQIVLDTPPTKHALDFLSASRRMSEFLDGSVVKWFLRPSILAGRAGAQAVRRGTRAVAEALDRLLGLSFIKDLSEFFQAFEGLFDGFRERARRVEEVLGSAETAFVLVTSPAPWTLAEADYFRGRLTERGMSLGAVVVNRVRADYGVNGTLSAADLARVPAQLAPLVPPLVASLEAHQALARGDARRLAALRERAGPEVPVATVPDFPTDVHDLEGLMRINAHLFR
ncbi:MAG: ArsA family ATPase [Planctomycetes bacterium]|nr:ArsA family ATPase [Planctomycetota bacterium]